MGIFIQKINIPIKTSCFVDDVSIFCQDTSDLVLAYKIVKDFSKSSGSDINKVKTSHVFLKDIMHTRHKNIKDKIFGLFLYSSQLDKIQSFQREELNTIQGILNKNSTRDISIYGKAKIINTLIVSKIIYYCTFYFYSTIWIKDFKKMVLKFLWPSIPYISIKKLYAPPAYAGIGLIDIKLIMIISKLRFFLNILENHSAESKLDLSVMPLCLKLNTYIRKNLTMLSIFTKIQINHSSQLHYGTILRLHYKNSTFIKISPRIFSLLHIIKLKPSIKTFILLMYHSSLPVKVNLKKHNLLRTQDTLCALCQQVVDESIEHLFDQCSVILSFKNWLAPFLPSMNNFDSLRTFEYKMDDIRCIKLLYSFWFSIWCARNQIIFNNSFIVFEQVFFSKLEWLVQYDRSFLNSSNFNMIWDSSFLKELECKILKMYTFWS